MTYRKLAIKGTKTKVAPLGLGCFALGGYFMGGNDRYYAYGKIKPEDAIETIRKAYDMGINLFDTADVYGVGYSEKALGEAVKEFRDDVVLATKFGNTFVEGDRKGDAGEKKTDETFIRNAIDNSMRRLQTDFIDIYQLHSSQHPIEDAQEVRLVLQDLVDEGRIGGYGWSTDDPQRMENFTGANSVQFILNILYRNDDMVDLVKEQEMVGLIRSPLASGTLTGKYAKGHKITDETHMLAKTDFNTERTRTIGDKLERLSELLKDDGRSIIQAQLAYIMAQNERIIPIPGAKNLDQITENAATLQYSPLSRELVREFDLIFADMQTTLVKNGKRDTSHLIHKK
ncbi:MAG: aldo/keto reductase [Candidatus Kariarchaeaceae archaeon]|jgi:aryl-alcohol dehydrogenase-like predicted oxidoreductase